MKTPMDRKFATGLLATLASEALGRGSALAFQFMVANQLGATNYGLVAIALASASLLYPLADMGLQNLSLTVGASDHGSEALRKLLSLKLLLAPAFLFPLAVWFFLVEDLGSAESLVCAGLFYFFQSAGDMLRQSFRAQALAESEFLARLGMPLGNAVSLFCVWYWKPGPTGTVAALCFGPAMLLLSYLIMLPKGSLRLAPPSTSFILARRNAGLIGQSVVFLAVVGFSTRIDAFVMQRHASSSELGRYFAALNFVMAGGFLALGFASYIYPRLYRQTSRRKRAFFRAASLQASLGISMMLGVMIVGPILFTKIFHSVSYSGAERILPVLAVVLFLSTLDGLWFNILLGKKKIWIASVGLVPIFAAKIILGPGWVDSCGANGMALATLVGSIFTTTIGAISAYFLFSKEPSAVPETA